MELKLNEDLDSETLHSFQLQSGEPGEMAQGTWNMVNVKDLDNDKKDSWLNEDIEDGRERWKRQETGNRIER